MRRARTREAKHALDAGSVERPASVEPMAASVMELQRTAGNQAVGSLLARDADTSDSKEREAGTTLVMPDPIGTIPVVSYSLAAADQIDVTVPNSAADPALFQAAMTGTFFAEVKLTGAGLEITLAEVVISSVQVGSGYVSFRLNAKRIKTDRPPEPKGKVE